MLAIATLLAGCHPPAPDNLALRTALHDGRPAEVTVRGRVVDLLPDGTGPDGPHERFHLDLGAGTVVEVDHNLTLAPRVPVAVGATLTVHGQFEPDPGHPVLHSPITPPAPTRTAGSTSTAGATSNQRETSRPSSTSAPRRGRLRAGAPRSRAGPADQP